MSFSRYAPEDSVMSSEAVVKGLWTGDNYTLNTFYSQSSQTEYYLNVYNLSTTTSGSAVQFSLQFGNLYGSGSVPLNSTVAYNTPSRIIYGQYRNLVYGTETTNFSVDGTNTTKNIYVINMSRARYKESLYPASFNLNLSGSSGTIRLTDDSNTTSLTRFIGENRYFNIISGSSGNAYSSSATNTYYGFLFPDLNIAVLDADKLIGFVALPNTSSVSSPVYNHTTIYDSIKKAASFTLNSQETISSRYFFTRVKNGEFNYTTNPSIIDSNGNLLYTSLVNSPQTYPTTIGLYNDNNELLAVAKLSRPITKDFTKEALIQIKLDY